LISQVAVTLAPCRELSAEASIVTSKHIWVGLSEFAATAVAAPAVVSGTVDAEVPTR
jgi:hypothetical protein